MRTSIVRFAKRRKIQHVINKLQADMNAPCTSGYLSLLEQLLSADTDTVSRFLSSPMTNQASAVPSYLSLAGMCARHEKLPTEYVGDVSPYFWYTRDASPLETVSMLGSDRDDVRALGRFRLHAGFTTNIASMPIVAMSPGNIHANRMTLALLKGIAEAI